MNFRINAERKEKGSGPASGLDVWVLILYLLVQVHGVLQVGGGLLQVGGNVLTVLHADLLVVTRR